MFRGCRVDSARTRPGTLKATELYRSAIEDGKVTGHETLLRGAGRDIKVDQDGTILLLIEHVDGGRILRLVPGWGRYGNKLL